MVGLVAAECSFACNSSVINKQGSTMYTLKSFQLMIFALLIAINSNAEIGLIRVSIISISWYMTSGAPSCTLSKNIVALSSGLMTASKAQRITDGRSRTFKGTQRGLMSISWRRRAFKNGVRLIYKGNLSSFNFISIHSIHLEGESEANCEGPRLLLSVMVHKI